MDTAEIVDQVIECIIQYVDAILGRGWRGRRGGKSSQGVKGS